MSRCECCRSDIADPVIKTVAGRFEAQWGLCPLCWAAVSRSARRGVVWARRAFAMRPMLEEAIALYLFWQIALAEALLCTGRRAAA